MRDMKRIENVSRSPWFSHISATVQGLSTIRAYNKNKEFADRYMFVCATVRGLFLVWFCFLCKCMGISRPTVNLFCHNLEKVLM